MVLQCILLLGVLFAFVGRGAGAEPTSPAKLRDAAIQSDKPERLADICSDIAIQGTPEAKALLLDILKDRDRVSLMCGGPIPWKGNAQFNLLAPRYYLERVLDALTAHWPDSVQDFLLVDLDRLWEPLVANDRDAAALVRSISRVTALGLVSNPSDATYALLERLLSEPANVLRGAASTALLRKGDRRAKEILLKVGMAEWQGSGSVVTLLNAQHARNKPAMLELLIEAYRMCGKSTQSALLLSAITSPGFAVNYPPASQIAIPAYEEIKDPKDLERMAQAIDHLIAEPGSRSLSDQEKNGLLTIRAKFKKLH